MSQQHDSSIPEHSLGRRWAAAACVVVAVMVGAESPLAAQAKKSPAAKPDEKKFEDLTLDAKDGMVIRGTYYPGPEKKTTVPLILVHDWNSNRSDMHGLALYLQALGHAVIVPDLRGHGMSVARPGAGEPIDREKMSRGAIESMVLDIEAAKTFLLQRNNEGKLNIEQLGVLGSGFGATLAVIWAVGDWNVRSLPTYKMGQDVKALILISPLQSFKGVSVNVVLKARATLAQLSVLTVVGQQDQRRYSDAKRIYRAFQQAHREGNEVALPFYEADTSLQGMELVYARGLQVPDWIRPFIEERLVKRGVEFPWTDRTSPLK
ncbi:MAG: alpha/beta hydrolase [Pirellulaceae bacterium]